MDISSWRHTVDHALFVLQHEARKPVDERDSTTIHLAVDILAGMADVYLMPDLPEVRDMQEVLVGQTAIE